MKVTPELTDNCQPNSLLRTFDGTMTRELLLSPGEHGLGMTPASLAADKTTTSVCGYCSTGCGLRIHLRDNLGIGLTPETSYPVNLGMACPKGWEALQVLDSADRAKHPMLRDSQGVMHQVSWHRALTEFCTRVKAVQSQYGPDSVAFLSTGQIANEEMALLGALTKFGMGIRHGDGNTRQCMATSVVAYKESFGFDAPPYTYEDFEQSDCLVFIGSNPCIAHPIMWERVLRNRLSPDIIVVDPRRTETASAATQHVQLNPKSDLVLLYAITRQLIQDQLIDLDFINNHTSGYDALAAHVEEYTLDKAAAETGLQEREIERVAHAIGTAEAASLWWTMGVNQSYQGVRTAQAIINIALITGNIGRPGTGANSITGQCNAMGSRLWSNTTNLLGHYKFESASDRAKVARTLGIDESNIPQQNSWSYEQILQAVRQGDIRALWIIGTNPAHSWIQQGELHELLGQLDFLVVQDMYDSTETVQHADLLLPAAGWGEKNGTFINSERRYGLLRSVRPAPGEALADFHIFRAIAKYWGVEDLFADWSSPEAVFRILQDLSQGQPCDITGISGYDEIDQRGGVQWPWSEASSELGPPTQHRRLFEDGEFYTSDRRARLIVENPASMPEPVDEEFPFLLLTGRGTASQWHTQTRTSKSPMLRTLYPDSPLVEINPGDADALQINSGDQVVLTSRRDHISAQAWVTPTVQPGQLFVPMHYPQINRLTLSHFDPYSRQPSYKDCAVRIHK